MTDVLHLLIPGLLGPWPGPKAPPVQAPGLARLLSRARGVVGRGDMTATLCSLFQVTTRPAPVAALTRLADGGTADGGWWLRADPVHLKADLRQVLLFDARHLDIKPTEAKALTVEFNATFAADGLRLEAPHPCRWYLRLAKAPDLHTHPLETAMGRDINPLLPGGGEARRWCARLTEIQMLFHGAAVNQKREAKGQPAINSVWLWGGGALPETVVPPARGLYGADPLLRGLARRAGVALSPPPDNARDWLQAGDGESDSLVLLETTRFDATDDQPLDWSEHMAALERDWFQPLLDGLGREIGELWLYPCNGRAYHVVRRDLRRFWRRVRPLDNHLTPA